MADITAERCSGTNKSPPLLISVDVEACKTQTRCNGRCEMSQKVFPRQEQLSVLQNLKHPRMQCLVDANVRASVTNQDAH